MRRAIVGVSACIWVAGTTPNTVTSTVNLAYDLTHDPQTRNVIKSEALWPRGETDGTLTARRRGLRTGDEYEINART